MASSRNLQVANADESKARVLEVLNDEPGVARDIVALNAGAALYAANVADSIQSGMQLALSALRNGDALRKLQDFVRLTQQLRGDPH
jgi:anthranilate phosphoribosyltransferase